MRYWPNKRHVGHIGYMNAITDTYSGRMSLEMYAYQVFGMKSVEFYRIKSQPVRGGI